MASWSLGKIFSVEEDEGVVKETTREVSESEDGSDSEDDEDALAAQAAFNKNKQNSSSARTKNETTGTSHSIRRYDEYGDFISRSERARAEKAGQLAAMTSAHTEGAANEKTGKRRVTFQEDDKLSEVHEIPKLTDEEKLVCFMTAETWQSIDTDIDITNKRWKNHTEGLIKFDEDNNSIRGIEDIIFRLDKNKPIYKHRKTVLEEVVRQKTENDYPNWKKLAAISEISSAAHRKQALALGKEDEQEQIRVWSPKPPPSVDRTVSAPVKGSRFGKKEKKRKGSLFSFFKKK